MLENDQSINKNSESKNRKSLASSLLKLRSSVKALVSNLSWLKKPVESTVEVPSEFNYHSQGDFYSFPSTYPTARCKSYLNSKWWKFKGRTLSQDFYIFSKNWKKIKFIHEDSSFYEDLIYFYEHGLDSKKLDLWKFISFKNYLFHISKLKGKNLKVLYIWSGNDNRVESVFRDTTHLDIYPFSGETKIEWKKVVWDIFNCPEEIRNKKYDLIVFRNINNDVLNNGDIFWIMNKLLNENWIVVDSVDKWLWYTARYSTLSRMHRTEWKFNDNWFKPVDTNFSSSFDRIYENL